LSVAASTQYDQFAFDGRVDLGAPEIFTREVVIECAEECALVFADEGWLGGEDLRLAIVGGSVRAESAVDVPCADRSGAIFGNSRTRVVADLVVAATSLVEGREVPESFVGEIVFDNGGFSDSDRLECTAGRVTIRFDPENTAR
jgi:hypothetical protein